MNVIEIAMPDNTASLESLLYDQPIADISWVHIQEFCKLRLPESSSLDYKQELPSDLDKTIAAMANTLGGIIIIGVATDKQERPICPAPGIEAQPRLEHRIIQIATDAIQPPVLVEIQLCHDASEEHALIVIRVPVSRLGHAIRSNTQIYIRTGLRNKPNALADVTSIRWLLDHRSALEARRQLILEMAATRNERIISITKIANDPSNVGVLRLSAAPTFPDRRLIDFAYTSDESIRRMLGVERTSLPSFPFTLLAAVKRYVAGGEVAVSHSAYSSGNCYHELNEFGIYYVAEHVVRRNRTGGEVHRKLRFTGCRGHQLSLLGSKFVPGDYVFWAY